NLTKDLDQDSARDTSDSRGGGVSSWRHVSAWEACLRRGGVSSGGEACLWLGKHGTGRRQRLRHDTRRVGAKMGEATTAQTGRSEEHTSELQSRENLVCRLLLEKKNIKTHTSAHAHTDSNPG